MAVINSNNGIAARNGTSSLTIPFGFTSSSGNLLAFVVAGAVTHTNAGWTEQLQPVSSGELSVFTKTSAGESSFTDTINASNYPVVWQVYEFNSGSTYVGGVSTNTTQGTNGASRSWPNSLTGLPGTAVRVIAANGNVNVGGGSVTLTSAWTAPFSLVVDLTAPAGSGTDGISMNVGMATGVTSTSSQPTWTPTWSAGSGWSSDMQAALFAISEPAVAAVIYPPRRRGPNYRR